MHSWEVHSPTVRIQNLLRSIALELLQWKACEMRQEPILHGSYTPQEF